MHFPMDVSISHEGVAMAALHTTDSDFPWRFRNRNGRWLEIRFFSMASSSVGYMASLQTIIAQRKVLHSLMPSHSRPAVDSGLQCPRPQAPPDLNSFFVVPSSYHLNEQNARYISVVDQALESSLSKVIEVSLVGLDQNSRQ